MGKGKLIKFQELESFDHVIQAPYRNIKDTDFELKGKWATSFFKNNNPVVLELGCGKGEYTVKLAEKFPENNYIGVDIKGARIWRGAKQSLEKGFKNVGFIRTNIEIINRFFSVGEVDEIWLTFP
ncbi:MAG: tRNA (guanosine(46)-N7)-methyltransferase TrmB, partial [Mariniphaga sp.]|nr:tRNA (guanosine(46)-N7)-methyltransferase TrmB [Mariniphaga sp.]